MGIVLSVLLILAVAAVFKYKGKVSELEATVDALELEILEIETRNTKKVNEMNRKWEEELTAYQITVDNLKFTQCKDECQKESEPVVTKTRKPRK